MLIVQNGTPGFRTCRMIFPLFLGHSSNPAQSILEADAVKDKDIVIHTVGIGSEVSAGEMSGIASGNTSFYVSDYSSLGGIVDSVVGASCQRAYQPFSLLCLLSRIE